MSLDTTLARISALETAFVPPSARVTTTAASSAAATPSSTFATQLQGAVGTGAATPTGGVSPIGSGGASAIVQIAEAEVGQAEQPPGSNDSPRIATYRTATVGAAAGEPWCAYFVSWAARQAGMPLGEQGQGYGYVGDIWAWAQRTGRAIPNKSGVVPTPGDLIVFGDHHVGLVEKVLPGGGIQTIEGNYSNQVSRVVRGAGDATGYVRMG